MDGLRPEPPVATSMEGAVVVSDWFRRVLHRAAVAAYNDQTVKRRRTTADAILFTQFADAHHWGCSGDRIAG